MLLYSQSIRGVRPSLKCDWLEHEFSNWPTLLSTASTRVAVVIEPALEPCHNFKPCGVASSCWRAQAVHPVHPACQYVYSDFGHCCLTVVQYWT